MAIQLLLSLAINFCRGGVGYQMQILGFIRVWCGGPFEE